MQLLFEQYFNDAMDFSREMYKNLRKSLDMFPVDEDVAYILSDDPLIHVTFVKTPHPGTESDLGGFYKYNKGKRSTVVTKSGKKQRRMLVTGGNIVINVANIIMKNRHLFYLYKDLKPFIIENGKNGYAISDDINAVQFATIVKALIKADFLAPIFAHEIQHFYNPWTHKRAESHRKVKTKLPPTRAQQRRLNYKRSNAEVDSNTIEAAVAVIGEPGKQDVFAQNTPANQREFVRMCVIQLAKQNMWNVYPQWLQKKIMKRCSSIYEHEMQRRANAE